MKNFAKEHFVGSYIVLVILEFVSFFVYHGAQDLVTGIISGYAGIGTLFAMLFVMYSLCDRDVLGIKVQALSFANTIFFWAAIILLSTFELMPAVIGVVVGLIGVFLGFAALIAAVHRIMKLSELLEQGEGA